MKRRNLLKTLVALYYVLVFFVVLNFSQFVFSLKLASQDVRDKNEHKDDQESLMFIRGAENETPDGLDSNSRLFSGPTGGTGVATTSGPTSGTGVATTSGPTGGTGVATTSGPTGGTGVATTSGPTGGTGVATTSGPTGGTGVATTSGPTGGTGVATTSGPTGGSGVATTSGTTGGTGVATTSEPPTHGDVFSSEPQYMLLNYNYLFPDSNYYLTAPGNV